MGPARPCTLLMHWQTTATHIVTPRGRFGGRNQSWTYSPIRRCTSRLALVRINIRRARCINGGAIIDHKAPREWRFVAVQK